MNKMKERKTKNERLTVMGQARPRSGSGTPAEDAEEIGVVVGMPSDPGMSLMCHGSRQRRWRQTKGVLVYRR